jgi:hypothetical protein
MRHTSPLEGGALPCGSAAFIVSEHVAFGLNFQKPMFRKYLASRLLPTVSAV